MPKQSHNARKNGEQHVSQAEFQDETTVVEIRRGTSALRDFRDGLAHLAGILAGAPAKHGTLVLMHARIGADNLDRELRRFRSSLRPEIDARLHVELIGDADTATCPAGMTPGIWERVQSNLGTVASHRTQLPRPQLQSEVVRVLLHQWLAGSGPLTSAWLAETVGCSYRTVAAAIASLGPAITRTRDRSVELGSFPREAWRDLVATTRTARSTVLYVDQSGQPRSAEYLAQKVQQLMRTDVAVGGVIGALQYCPSLDIVGAPRLDVCVHAPSPAVEPLPVEQLDPGLVESVDPRAPARLAVHFLRRRTSFFHDAGNGARWADPVECLLDLHEARLDMQAEQLLEHLQSRGIGVSGGGP
jgi:hypothetical protein